MGTNKQVCQISRFNVNKKPLTNKELDEIVAEAVAAEYAKKSLGACLIHPPGGIGVGFEILKYVRPIII